MKAAAKAIAYLIFAALTALASALTDDVVTGEEWINISIAGATAVGVWLTANLPQLIWAKTATAAVLAGLNVLVSAITNGNISNAEWVNIALAVIGVIAVYFTPDSVTPRAVPAAHRGPQAV